MTRTLLIACMAVTACSGTEPAAPRAPAPGAPVPCERHVQRADFGETWPFTVESSTLRCEPPSVVTFRSNAATYALNGVAGNAASRRGWKRVDAIWAVDEALKKALFAEDGGFVPRIDMSPMIDAALALCE
ncbi:MAG: hypothetical protein AMXMBFR64_62190 [Myxococcales bacterium]